MRGDTGHMSSINTCDERLTDIMSSLMTWGGLPVCFAAWMYSRLHSKLLKSPVPSTREVTQGTRQASTPVVSA